MISVGRHGEMRQQIKAGPSLQIQEKKTEDCLAASFYEIQISFFSQSTKVTRCDVLGRIKTCFYTELFIFREVPHNLKNEARVCPSERFLDPPINFVHDEISIYY